jgi:Family of unknown function (DUF5691)
MDADVTAEVDDPDMEALLRSFLLGTERHPLPAAGVVKDLVPASDPTAELTALALAGQRLRLRRPVRPPAADAPRVVEDRRAVVAEDARSLMRRLVGGRGGSATDVAASSLADTCNRRGLRPHPFDMPRIDAFIRTHAERLGSSATAWVERGGNPEVRPSHYFDAQAVDATNWTSAGPAARAAFIASMRANDPDGARALVEASFASEPAPLRVRLVDALAHRLSAADVPFLEGLAGDRAPSVREAAVRLLKCIPGTNAADGLLDELVGRIKVSTSGLLRRRTVLALEPPASLPRSADAATPSEVARRWAATTYAGVGLEALATSLGLTVADMVEAAREDGPLLALLACQASIEMRLDVLAAIVREHACNAWADAIWTVEGTTSEVHGDTTLARWSESALVPTLWPALPSANDLERLYGFLRRPMPRPQAEELLRAPVFAAFGKTEQAAGVTARLSVAIAVLMPASLRLELRRELMSRTPEEAGRAVLLLDCLTLLDPSPAS